MMPTVRSLAAPFAILALLCAVPAWAQKGTGEETGVARAGELPAVRAMSGTIQGIEIGACEKTTGRSPMGAHLGVETEGGVVNLHLGPVSAVDHVLEQLSIGQAIGFQAFRTEALAEDAWIAKSLEVDGKRIVLRDDGLRPAWAYGRGGGGGRRGGGPGRCW